ncbi:MAG: chromosomal replication initiator protein DnaA [Parcubacteria group bacterium]|nr:chromosomal replication initiator protein DnaA [Parcubacteria group bacterium]
MDKDELWHSALAEIELSLSKPNFVTWFRNTSLASKKDGVAFVSTPSTFIKEWLEDKYNLLILKTLRGISNDIKEVRFIIKPPTATEESKSAKKKELLPPILTDHQLNLSESGTPDKETNLNPKYTLDSFIVGSSNQLAHAAAVSVSKNIGAAYNPLFIYGGVGLGKTHLLQAIGNEIIKNNPKNKVRYMSSEKFLGDLINSIRNRTVEKFKEEYKKINLLIVDDIQFIAGKEKTQEEFFHIFNELYANNNQIVLSSDRPPKAIPTLEERLRSRFEGGMIADITPPDYETRVAILKAKITEKKLDELGDDVLGFIAGAVTKNIRELEGTLNRVMMSCQVANIPPTLDKVKSILSITNNNNKTSPKIIIKTVSEFYDIKEDELINQSRKREIVLPRQICMYLMREELRNSYPFIGSKFGGRDHTTVMHACDKISREIQTNENLMDEINIIKGRIYEL